MTGGRKIVAWAIAAALAGSVGSAAAQQGVDRAGNLAKVPATDPKPESVPAIVAAMKGQHPRVLFGKSDIEGMKKQIASDPILKKAYDDNAAWAKRFKLATAWMPRNIVKDDTSALTMLKQWPGLAYVYAIDRDPNVKQAITDILQMMLEEPHWADTAELDSNMGAGNNMLMVGILFDVIHDDLEPEFRAKVAQKILTHVRRMHYLGYKQLSLMPIKYWQQDPQNNHRWHRNAGMAACLAAIADEPGIDAGYLLAEHKKEMDFIIKWLPADGDCHEGAGYQIFGFSYLCFGAMITDRLLGTEYMKAPGIRNAWAQHLYFSAPGRTSSISFGDDMNGEGWFDNQETAFFMGPRITRDKNVQAALKKRFEKKSQPRGGRAYSYPWAFLSFYDPTVGEGDYKAVPTSRVFADLGAASMRDSWEDDAVCLTFKCGPYGGYKLNEYAHANKDEKGKPHYVNVAHDDPDANSFALGMAGEFIFHPGVYSLHKITEKLNTLTVDGKGQIGEGQDFTQPVPDVDMRTLSYLTTWKQGEKGRVVIEGEAGKTYAGLTGFRRTAVWMPGEYVLLLDDIKADGKHRVTWRGTVPKGQFEKPEAGKCYIATKGGKKVDMQILANQPFSGTLDFAYIDGRFGNALMQQFQFTAETDAVKFACLLDPWKKKAELSLVDKGDVATLTVKGEGFEDTWTWTRAKDANSPALIAGKRGGAELINVTERDKAPHGD